MPNIAQANVEGSPEYPRNPPRSGFFRELLMRLHSPWETEPQNENQENLMNQHVDRRSLLAGAATISAVGTASIAAAEAGTVLEGEILAEWVKLTTEEKREFLQWWAADGELVRLGADLDRLLDEWRPIREETARLCELWYEKADAEGVSPEACDRARTPFGQAEYVRFYAINAEVGADPQIKIDNKHLELIDTVNRKIRSIKPSTLSGLAVWAKAARFDVMGLDVDTPIADLDDLPKEVAAQFFDEVERLAGLSTHLNEATQPSSVMALFKEWTEQRDAANVYGAAKDHDEDHLSILFETANTTMTRLLGLPARDIRDLAAKLVAATDHGAYPDLAGFEGSISLLREAATIVGRVEHLENV